LIYDLLIMTDYIKDMGCHLTVEQVAKRMGASPKKVRRQLRALPRKDSGKGACRV
jgi:AraC-like DNA-binding protein